MQASSLGMRRGSPGVLERALRWLGLLLTGRHSFRNDVSVEQLQIIRAQVGNKMVDVCRLYECTAGRIDFWSAVRIIGTVPGCGAAFDGNHHGAWVTVPAAKSARRKHHILLHEVGWSFHFEFGGPLFSSSMLMDFICHRGEAIKEVEHKACSPSRQYDSGNRKHTSNQGPESFAEAHMHID